jgi:thiol-disulfide isomerase/thioredoxin
MNTQICCRVAVALCLLVGACPVVPAAARGAQPDGPPTGGIAGRVLDAKGDPVRGALLILHQSDRENHGWKEPPAAVRSGERGEYEFRQLPEGWFIITAESSGFAKAFRATQLEARQQLTVDVGLREPVQTVVLLRNERNQPVAGARIRFLLQRGVNGRFLLYANDLKTFGMTFNTSDKEGRLELPPLPAASTVTVTIDHDDFAPAQLKDAALAQGRALTVTMRRGVRLTFRLQPEDLARRISQLDIDLRHEPFQHPSTIVSHRIPVANAIARVTVEPGSYRVLWLKHRDFLITPWYTPDIGHGSFLRLAPGKDETFPFVLHRKVVVRGRVINEATGQPVADCGIHGEIATPVPSNVGKTYSEGWMHADWGKTDRNGQYELTLAAGPARITFSESNLFAKDAYTNLVVAPDGSTAVPDIRVRPLPKVSGRVVGPDGRPIPKTIVRFRGKLEFLQPTLADESGRFEIPITWLPEEEGQRVLVHPLVAFHAYEPLGARVDVHLDRPETLTNLLLKLQPEPYEHQLSDVAGDMSAWERGDLSPELRKTARLELRGQPAPELECGSWVNTPRPHNVLSDFRGKYVLLDFWTVWCGPCHGDFPSVKLAHELYRDHGFTVVGVHDNSVPPDAIGKHVASQKLLFPIAIDTADGRTLTAYKRCGVIGFPSYLLLGPDGTILHCDSSLPGPSLRSFKLEIIRAHLMGDASHAKL